MNAKLDNVIPLQRDPMGGLMRAENVGMHTVRYVPIEREPEPRGRHWWAFAIVGFWLALAMVWWLVHR